MRGDGCGRHTDVLNINHGGTATYTSGSVLQRYTLAVETCGPTATAVNLNGGTIKHGAAASLSLTGLTQTWATACSTTPFAQTITVERLTLMPARPSR